jgi:cell division protein FtsW (lipid II flippase)
MMREVVIDDHSFYLKFRPDRIPFQPLLLLYVPFFGGILYRYKDKGKSGFVKCILWMFVPVLLSFLLNEFLLSSALLAIMLVQFCYVIRKGWFTPIHKRFCFLMSSLAGYLITAILYFDYFSKMHHEFRILSFYLGTHGYQERDKVRELLLGSTLLGENTTGSFFGVGAEPSNYIMTFLISNFGVIVAGLLLLILSYFTYKLFRISFKQKNQLGLIIGLGCSLVFAVQIGMYVLSNLSFLPSMPGYLPLFSPGSIGTIVTYGLLGILLSIYRYKDVTPESPVITSRFKPFNRIVQKRLEGTVPCATIEQK